MSRCDRCSADFDTGFFTLYRVDGELRWAAIFCSQACRDSFIEKYRGDPDRARDVLALHAERLGP
jgi:hypothetical protein